MGLNKLTKATLPDTGLPLCLVLVLRKRVLSLGLSLSPFSPQDVSFVPVPTRTVLNGQCEEDA